MFDKFTNRAKQVVKLAKKEAQRLNHKYLGTEHVLLGLLKLGQGIAVNVLRHLNVDYEAVLGEIERVVGFGPEIRVYGDPALTGKVKKVFESANEEATDLSHSYVGTEHLLLALLRQHDGVAGQILENLRVDPKAVRREILKELETFNLQLPPVGVSGEGLAGGREKVGSGGGMIGGGGSDKMPALRAYGHDLTELSREGKLDPVIGRAEEVERLILILCRRRKNNPVLIGEAGVGKTAIVEGLAHAIVKGEVPDHLAKKKLISLDLTLMIAGTKYRGQFEERIKAVMDEVKKHGDILLFIDELHTIVGAGAAEGAIDASNILKPSLSRGEVQCIGATTLDEYRKHIEKDAALERRFQKINIMPPTVEEATQILMGLRKKYGAHHKCIYTDDAIRSAVYLSDRYVTGRFLPDKAIDLIDEAGAKGRISMLRQPQEAHLLEAEIETLRKAKEESIGRQEYEKAARLRDKEKSLRERLQRVHADWEEQKERHQVIIDEEDVAAIVAKHTGISIARITEGEAAKLLKMEELLMRTVVGQNRAVETICRSLRRSKADIKDPNRPIGAFLLLGPTGVGKTLLAKALAVHMFGGEDALIQVDMSEYMEKFAVSRMTGSPPGYVGHEEGGQLTERVRRRPYSVVLFDEVEKAHPDVMNLLLQVLEDGRLTDSVGRKVDFRNTIVLMTSNLGSDLIRRTTEVGFGVKDGMPDYDTMKEKIDRAVKKNYKPEFINRLDDTIIFKALDREDLTKIVHLETDKLRERLARKNIELVSDDSAVRYLVEEGYRPEMGARKLRRVLEKQLEDPLAEKLLLEGDKPREIAVSFDGNRLIFKDTKKEKEKKEKGRLVGSAAEKGPSGGESEENEEK
ncbi:MAG: ATP-dependent Clp protease ATP-binding subunit [Simkaniaceae bacterium]|nr:ATP-dependent Clp protease ATP-binding subunit [Simkaniaceae bacterium]